jgi:hypothetical protein
MLIYFAAAQICHCKEIPAIFVRVRQDAMLRQTPLGEFKA